MNRHGQILFSLDDQQRSDGHLVIINNSPIRPYHVLLVPDRHLEQPQVSLTVKANAYANLRIRRC